MTVFTKSEQNQIDKDYKELVSKFKPEFGNVTHITLLKQLHDVETAEAAFEKRIEAQKELKTKSRLLYEQKTRAINSLRYIMKSLPIN